MKPGLDPQPVGTAAGAGATPDPTPAAPHFATLSQIDVLTALVQLRDLISEQAPLLIMEGHLPNLTWRKLDEFCQKAAKICRDQIVIDVDDTGGP